MSACSKRKLFCLAACLLWAFSLAAEQPPHAEILTAHRIGVTPPMANYMATHHPAPNAPFRVFPLRKPATHPGKGGGNGGGGGKSWTDPVLQSSTSGTTQSYSAGNGFAGISGDGYVPPDTNISVGDNQIVETVNVDYAVYNKSGGLDQAVAPIHAIFAAAGGILSNSMCTSVDGGDPIVLYDKIDKKWIISQLAYNNGLSNNHFCLAISTTSDATGPYMAYDFSFGKSFPDYPKLGIWATRSLTSPGTQHSGVYFSANIFSHGNTFAGAEMCGFPLSDVASPPSTLTMACYVNGSSVFSVLPADLEGSPGVSGTTNPAPAGTAEYFMQFTGSNTLNLFQFNPNFGGGTPSVSGPFNIPVAPFQEACGGSACVPQYNTSEQLDSLGDRLMYRLSYRNYGASGQSMVVTQSVQNSSASSQTGVRWYQLTSANSATTASSWKVAKQGTFGPSDGDYRWMGSIAQDKIGDLGIGYSVSSSTTYPDFAFTGRTPTDPITNSGAAELEPETLLNIGLGSQTSVNRWGDYSSMSVDPTNDCTMWYANEYLKSMGSYTNWGTYIKSFKFNGCS